MSKKRQGDENPESPDNLRALIESVARDGAESSKRWAEVWDAMLDDPWVRAELVRRAKRLVKSCHLHDDDAEDVVQHVLAKLAANRAANQVMHGKLEKFPKSFSAWIREILKNACSEGARMMGCYRKPGTVLLDVKTYEEDWGGFDRRWDIATVAAKLPEPERSIVTQFLQGVKRKMIAESRGLSYKQVVYAIQKAGEKLRPGLAGYENERKNRPK